MAEKEKTKTKAGSGVALPFLRPTGTHERPQAGRHPAPGYCPAPGVIMARWPGRIKILGGLAVHLGPASKRWRTGGQGLRWSPQERASHGFKLAFSQVVNTPLPGWVEVFGVGPSVQAAAGPTWPRLAEGDEPTPPGR